MVEKMQPDDFVWAAFSEVTYIKDRFLQNFLRSDGRQ